jgi:hypothetical protein
MVPGTFATSNGTIDSGIEQEASAPSPDSDASSLELSFVNRRLVVGRGLSASGPLVRTIVVDGKSIYPPQCAATPSSSPFCGPAFADLGKDGRYDLIVVESKATDTRVDLLLAAIFEGSPECGAYGYLLLRMGANARTTAPIKGCFLYSREALPTRSVIPRVEWGSPIRLFVVGEGGVQLGAKAEWLVLVEQASGSTFVPLGPR